jgi:ethanolamine utilization cobalamin adenosyltransferase
MLLQLNLLHCQVRETELVATTVLSGPDSNLIQALNRLSRAVYELMLLFKAGKFAWKAPGWLEQTRESRA